MDLNGMNASDDEVFEVGTVSRCDTYDQALAIARNADEAALTGGKPVHWHVVRLHARRYSVVRVRYREVA